MTVKIDKNCKGLPTGSWTYLVQEGPTVFLFWMLAPGIRATRFNNWYGNGYQPARIDAFQPAGSVNWHFLVPVCYQPTNNHRPPGLAHGQLPISSGGVIFSLSLYNFTLCFLYWACCVLTIRWLDRDSRVFQPAPINFVKSVGHIFSKLYIQWYHTVAWTGSLWECFYQSECYQYASLS